MVCFHICSVLGNCGYIWGLCENMFVEFLCVFKEHSRLDEYFLWYLFAFFIRRFFLPVNFFCINVVMELCVCRRVAELYLYWRYVVWFYVNI